MNTQTISLEKPEKNQKAIVLTLFCINCSSYKTFTITQSLASLLNRHTSDISYESECSSCKNKFKVELRWG